MVRTGRVSLPATEMMVKVMALRLAPLTLWAEW